MRSLIAKGGPPNAGSGSDLRGGLVCPSHSCQLRDPTAAIRTPPHEAAPYYSYQIRKLNPDFNPHARPAAILNEVRFAHRPGIAKLMRLRPNQPHRQAKTGARPTRTQRNPSW